MRSFDSDLVSAYLDKRYYYNPKNLAKYMYGRPIQLDYSYNILCFAN